MSQNKSTNSSFFNKRRNLYHNNIHVHIIIYAIYISSREYSAREIEIETALVFALIIAITDACVARW